MKKTITSTMTTLLALVATSGAATVTVAHSNSGASNSATENTGNSSWNTIGTYATWSNGGIAAAGNDYVVGSGQFVRSPATGVSGTKNFLGDTVTVGTSGTLVFVSHKTTEVTGTSTSNVPSLILSGGEISNYTGNFNYTLTGNILFSTSTISRISVNNVSHGFIFGSLVAGDGTLGTNGSATNPLISFTNALNTYSGLLNLDRGILDFGYDTNNTLGVASLNLSGTGTIQLDQNLIFNSLRFGGTAISNGTYTQSDLETAGYTSYFTGSTAGKTITVIPEPSSLLLGALGTLVLLRRRNR